MKFTRILPVLLAACLTTGCNSKQVELYAQKLQELLGDYRAGVLARADAERKLYAVLSESFANEGERDVYESLRTERLFQQRLLTGDIQDGRLAPSQVNGKLRETALAEFDRTRAWFEQELTAQEKYQSGLAKIAVDAKKLDALDSALKSLQEKTGLRDALGDVFTFRDTFKTEFDLQSCKDLERQIGLTSDSIDSSSGDQRLAALKAEKAALQSQLDANSHYKPIATTPSKKKCQ